MTLPVVPIHDPVANPDAGSDLPPGEVSALEEEIRALAKEQDAVILAHNYQLPEIQKIADHVGDSLQLAITGKKVPQSSIVFCGVHFMAESAKVLAPEKRVLLPNLSAGCSLADSITPESLEDWKERYPDHAVVTYVNSTAEVKALSDICCTSANAAESIPSSCVAFTFATPAPSPTKAGAVCVPVNVFAPSVAAPAGNGTLVSPEPSPTKAGAVWIPVKVFAPSVAAPSGTTGS